MRSSLSVAYNDALSLRLLCRAPRFACFLVCYGPLVLNALTTFARLAPPMATSPSTKQQNTQFNLRRGHIGLLGDSGNGIVARRSVLLHNVHDGVLLDRSVARRFWRVRRRRRVCG